jgi:DNA-binding beta-propeller fold protein YncE
MKTGYKLKKFEAYIFQGNTTGDRGNIKINLSNPLLTTKELYIMKLQQLFMVSAVLTALYHATPVAVASDNNTHQWQSATIGSVSSGSGRVEWTPSGNQATLTGSGDGDGGQFVYQPIEGNFELVATIARLPEKGRVGLMIREGLEADARFELIYLTPEAYVGTDARQRNSHYALPGKSEASKPMPVELKAARYGDEIAFYVLDKDPATPPRVRDHATLRGLKPGVLAGIFVNSGSEQRNVTAVFREVSLGPLVRTYTTSWLGNSLAGSFHAVQQQVQSLAVEPKSGRIYLNAQGDEGDKFGGIYSPEGDQISSSDNGKMLRRSGYGIAVTPEVVFRTCQDQGKKAGHNQAFFISKTDPYGRALPIPKPDLLDNLRAIPVKDHCRGLAASEKLHELYVSNTAGDEIRVYDFDLKLLRTFHAPRPGAIALTPEGDLWIVQRSSGREPAAVMRYALEGSPCPGRITGLDSPEGIAVGADGRVWVADSGPRSQILIFRPDGTPDGTFGVNGGVLSGMDGTPPGQVTPLKLNRPVGVGLDAVGNIIVAAGKLDAEAEPAGIHTTELRKFAPDGHLLWELYGLEAMNMAGPEPGTDGQSFYTPLHRYTMDYAKPPGQDIRYAAFTMDIYRYPEDPRVLEKMTGAIVRCIGGKKILFAVANTGQAVAAYRFAPDSEIAIPTLLWHLADSKTKFDPVTAPDSAQWLWRDVNHDGCLDAQEFVVPPWEDKPRDCFIDDAGGLWFTSKAKDSSFRYYPCKGLDAHGAPVYELDDGRVFQPPPVFTELGRLYYEPSSDTLYLGGYTKERPHEGKEFKQFGTEVLTVHGWLRGERRPGLRFTVPYVSKGKGGHEAFSAQALWVAGDFIFVGISASAEVIVYDRVTGKRCKVFVPGPEVGGRGGLLDLTYSVNAFRRSNGEYVILVESNDQAKVLAYRWDGRP